MESRDTLVFRLLVFRLFMGVVVLSGVELRRRPASGLLVPVKYGDSMTLGPPVTPDAAANPEHRAKFAACRRPA